MQALPFLQMAGSVVQGVAGLQAGNANYRAGMEAAREREVLGAEEERRIRAEARKAIGEQAAVLNAGGFMGDSGSALDALRESQVQAALDVLTTRRSRQSEARSLRAQARQERTQGRFALVSGILGAGSSYQKQRNDWAQARAGEGVGAGGGGGS